MSNTNASVSNELRDRSVPKTDDIDLEMRTQETKGFAGHSNPTIPNRDSVDNSNVKIKAKSIGNYILGKTLGEGTFGKVKLATHILTGEKVAIKILEKDRIIDVSDVERVAREIYILKFIRHPNIIQLYEIIETPKQLFLVTEYISGGELFDYIVANTRVEEKEASKFFHQIIAGVEYIHKLKIVHRDLKPENLLLDYNKNIKIVDFGLSNTYGENELLKTACGSPCYAAPEMIGGKKYNGLQVDIWSCGVILFAIVCGYLPFEDPNTAVLYKKILSGDYTIPSFVSEEGRDLIKNVLNTDPTKRFTIEDIRKHPWMNQVEFPKKSEGIIVGYHQMPIDLNVLSSLEQYGFQNDNAQKCLDANKHNHVTTTYYLLLRKFHQSGGQSFADINSDTFDKVLLMPKTHQPKINNYYSVGADAESEKENKRDKRRKRSTDQNQSFMYAETSFRQRQSKEIAKIYGSILDSSSRDRVSSSNYSSKGSRILKESDLMENQNEVKRKSIPGNKRGPSPTRNDTADNRSSKVCDTKEMFTPSNNYKSNAPKPNHFFNKSFNNSTLKERLREIYRIGGDSKGTKVKHPRGESYDESNNNGLYQSLNQELLNESFKFDGKDTNNSMIYPMQPKLHSGNTGKNANKKQAFISIQSTPKKEKRVVHQLEEKSNPNPTAPYDSRQGSIVKAPSSTINNPDKSRTSSQSPARLNQILPKEPAYTKPRDSSVNPYRAKMHSRKNSSRPAVQINNGKAWRPSTNQSRERGRSIGVGDESIKSSQNAHEMSVNLGSASYMLNSSFQQKSNNNADQSFDYSSHQPKAYMSNINKRISYGGESQNKRTRGPNFSPVDIHRKNLQSLLNKSGVVKC